MFNGKKITTILISIISIAILLMTFTGCLGGPQSPTYSSSLPSDINNFSKTQIQNQWAIDLINGQTPTKLTTIKDSSDLAIVGWTINDTTKRADNRIFIELTTESDNSSFYIESGRFERQDIADWLGAPLYKNAGFAIAANIEDLPKDTYQIRVIQEENGILYISQPSLFKLKIE